jgi:hypothetical protein
MRCCAGEKRDTSSLVFHVWLSMRGEGLFRELDRN